MASEDKTRIALFGNEIAGSFGTKEKRDLKSFIPKDDDLGDVATITTGGNLGWYYDLGTNEHEEATEKELIEQYRGAAEHSEVDSAISDIVDEAVASLEKGPSIKLVADDIQFDDSIKKKIYDEFDSVVRLLNFSKTGADIFRRWYIDGRLYFHLVVDSKKPKDGIQELRYIDPAKIKRVKEVTEEIDKATGAKISETVAEYYIYTEEETEKTNVSGGTMTGLKIAKEAIVEVNSGLMDKKRKRRISHLHKSLKIINQLRIMEDALVIYRLARAPERRIFYIDTGNLPKGKAEEYLRQVMSKYRNKIVYNAKTGEVEDERRHMSMLEDFWIPRREGSQGTEVSTLPGGENLGQIDDILYFKNQLYKSLNIPQSRIDPEAAFPGGSGRATEITRDEVKFQKFINRLRKRFSWIFFGVLKVQLILKGIITEDDWKKMEQDMNIDFVQDNHFYEIKEFELLKDKIDMLDALRDHIGVYFSKEWVQKNILHQTEEEVEEIEKQIKANKDKPQTDGEDEGSGGEAEDRF